MRNYNKRLNIPQRRRTVAEKPLPPEEAAALREAMRWKAGELLKDSRGQMYQVQLNGEWRKVKMAR